MDSSGGLKAPFPWFGGKSKVADIVWRYFGDVEHYVEPFAGSLAVLLGRPVWHKKTSETVNDIDAYIVNFWRAVQHAPEEVAYYANNPVNEVDLTARHIWLVQNKEERLSRLQGDPDYYDAKVAGWWVWGICCWIGGGWCAGTGPWVSRDGKLANLRTLDNRGDDRGVNRQRVHIGNPGQEVNTTVLREGGVSKRRATIQHGLGINRLSLMEKSVGNYTGTDYGLEPLIGYMQQLAERLRYVRVCCGDWKRVVTRGALAQGKSVGIFLDPPYSVEVGRTSDIYVTDKDSHDISKEVYKWCMENASNPRYRIALCGYEGEHEMPGDWLEISWTANRSYGRADRETANSANRFRERIWFSPNCLINYTDNPRQSRLPIELKVEEQDKGG